MGCGNNKVSRSYLTSQPITTPSARAAKASVADLGSQILRLVATEMKDSARRAEKARRARANDAKKAAARAAATKASDDADKKARKQEQEAEEFEVARRLSATYALHALEPVRLPSQSPKTWISDHGKRKEVDSYVRRMDEDGTVHHLLDADGNPDGGPLHIHSIIKPSGHIVLKATDRRSGPDEPADHFAEIKITIPDPPAAMYDAAFDVIADLLRERA